MAKDGKGTRGTKHGGAIADSATLLRRELRRRGIGEAEIDDLLRKKRRRRVLEFDLVKSHHLVDMNSEGRVPPRAKKPKRGRRDSRQVVSDELCTVEFAADQLKLHPRTVQRIIREGRLPARRIGKSYRIRRSDLESFAGLPAASAAALPPPPTMTGIIDVQGVDADTARLWARSLATAAQRSRNEGRVRGEIIHDSASGSAKIIVIGSTDEALSLLTLARVWTEQLER